MHGTKENANCKVGKSLEIEGGELFDPSIQPNSLRNLVGWTDESTQKSELSLPPEKQKIPKSKTAEPEDATDPIPTATDW